MKSTLSYVLVTLAVWIVGVSVRYIASLHPHSGLGCPPMHGDFEAQRHWIELTSHLPVSDWYVNSTHNDLLYWGIDYPPLTAYHSWFVGVGSRFLLSYAAEPLVDKLQLGKFNGEETWEKAFALHSSRGSEHLTTIEIMRISSILSDLMSVFPAATAIVALFTHIRGGKDQLPVYGGALLLFLVFLSLPYILIDHGHFQYNSVSLALALWSFYFSFRAIGALFLPPTVLGNVAFHRNVLMSIVAIVCSILFKQMSLYYTPALGLFYLAACLIDHYKKPPTVFKAFGRLICCAWVGFGAMAVVFIPFLWTGTHRDVLSRMFPVGRGLYEDKVASFWCAISPVFKVHNYVLNEWVPKLFFHDQPSTVVESLNEKSKKTLVAAVIVPICAMTTIATLLPGVCAFVANLVKYANGKQQQYSPTRSPQLFFFMCERFMIAVAACAFSFFFFSYHVHEKSVLLPLLPTAVLGVIGFVSDPACSTLELRLANKYVAFSLSVSTASILSLYHLVELDRLEYLYFGFLFASLSCLMLCASCCLSLARATFWGAIAAITALGVIVVQLLISGGVIHDTARYPDLRSLITLEAVAWPGMLIMLPWLHWQCFEIFAAVAKKDRKKE